MDIEMEKVGDEWRKKPLKATPVTYSTLFVPILVDPKMPKDTAMFFNWKNGDQVIMNNLGKVDYDPTNTTAS